MKKYVSLVVLVVFFGVVVYGLRWRSQKLSGRSTSTTPGGAAVQVAGDGATPEGLTPAPEGFTWGSCLSLGGWNLLPVGWYQVDIKEDGTARCLIARERVTTVDDEYSAGMSITAAPKEEYDDSGDVTAFQVAESVLEKPVVKPHPDPALEGYEEIVQEGQVMHYKLTVGNNETSTVYLFDFKAPLEEWEEQLAISQQMIGSLYFDPTL